MPKYRCTKTCFYKNTFYKVGQVVELPTAETKYLEKIDPSRPAPPAGSTVEEGELDFMSMTPAQLKDADYKVGELRGLIKRAFDVDLAPNTARASVIQKFVELRMMSRK